MAKPEKELTPMQRQYQQIKEQNQDCILFFRLGDFYEMFNEDAKLAARAKNFAFTYENADLSRISSPVVIDEMRLAFDVARPMYEFMMDAYKQMIDEGLIKPED